MLDKKKDKFFWNSLTSFQKKVYKIVQTIPKGETRSYKWVARKIDKPKAYRAVALVLKKNTRFDIVPCHRVIRSDGTLGGYVKGEKTKRKLLRQEKVKIK